MDLKNYAKQRLPEWSKNVIKKNWKYKLINSIMHKGSSVLDIGCASWAFAHTWKDKDIKYFGIDYNNHFVEYCSRHWLTAKQCDISKEKIPYEDNSFDFIYCSHVIEHLLSNEQIFFMQEINRVLKKWGKVIIFAPTPYHWYFWDDPTHQRPCTHGQLMALAKDANLQPIYAKYSLMRCFWQALQRWLRLPPLRWFLWEVYMVAQKNAG